MIHSFLLIGQSNMAGRGFASEVNPIPNDHIKVLRNGRWWPMYTPVNCDRVTSGINLAESFAEAYAREHGVDVGLIPCADGGTSLNQWQIGGLLHTNVLYQCELATRTSTIAGVLWHQGESDTKEECWPYYEEKCTKILQSFRQRLHLEDVPFLVGGLGDYLKDFRRDGNTHIARNYPRINEALQSMASKDPMMGFVPAEGLGANPDNLHFSAKALREFGLRYYEVFKTLENKDKVFHEKDESCTAIRSDIEFL